MADVDMYREGDRRMDRKRTRSPGRRSDRDEKDERRRDRGDRRPDDKRDKDRDYKRKKTSPPPLDRRERRHSPRHSPKRSGFDNDGPRRSGFSAAPDPPRPARTTGFDVLPPGPVASAPSRGHEGRLTFKQYLAGLDDDVSPAEAQQRYEEYKNEHDRKLKETFFAVHKEEDWLRDKYDPTRLEVFLQKRNENAQNIAKEIFGALQAGNFEAGPNATNERPAEDDRDQPSRRREHGGGRRSSAAELDMQQAPKAPSVANSPQRIKKDTARTRALAAKLDAEKGVTESPLTAGLDEAGGEGKEGGSESGDLDLVVLIKGREIGLEGLELLDVLLTYLWRVHGLDYYGAVELRGLSRGLRHVRPSSSTTEGADADPEMKDKKWEESVDATWQARLAPGGQDPLVLMLGRERVEKVTAEVLEAHVRKIKDEKYGWKYGCGAKGCTKLFHGAEFVHKHLKLKHPEILTEATEKLRSDIYFDNYLKDPSAPLPTAAQLPPAQQNPDSRGRTGGKHIPMLDKRPSVRGRPEPFGYPGRDPMRDSGRDDPSDGKRGMEKELGGYPREREMDRYRDNGRLDHPPGRYEDRYAGGGDRFEREPLDKMDRFGPPPPAHHDRFHTVEDHFGPPDPRDMEFHEGKRGGGPGGGDLPLFDHPRAGLPGREDKRFDRERELLEDARFRERGPPPPGPRGEAPPPERFEEGGGGGRLPFPRPPLPFADGDGPPFDGPPPIIDPFDVIPMPSGPGFGPGPPPQMLIPVPGAGPLGPFVPAPPDVAMRMMREQQERERGGRAGAPPPFFDPFDGPPFERPFEEPPYEKAPFKPPFEPPFDEDGPPPELNPMDLRNSAALRGRGRGGRGFGRDGGGGRERSPPPLPMGRGGFPPPLGFMPLPPLRHDPRAMRSYRDLDAPDDEVTVIDYRSI